MALHYDLTEGDVNRHIVRFASPLLLSNVFQALYNAVDMLFVGKYMGTEGISAVSISGTVINILLMTIAGMSVGVSVVIGAHSGKGDQAGVKKAAGTAISLYAICALAISLLGLLLSPVILRLVSTPEEAFPHAVGYLRIMFTGVVFTMGYNLICAFQRGLGDSRSSLLFVLIATILNAGLDYLFLGAFHWGAEGAAFATVISQAASFFMGVLYFKARRHVISFAPKAWGFDRACIREFMRIGLPSALQQLQLTISHLMLNGLVNTYGLAISAAYGIGVKIDSFAILPSNAINDAVAAFASQNLGAGKEERAVSGINAARRLSIPLNMGLLLIIAAFAPKITGIFNGDPMVIEASTTYLRTVCIMYVLYAMVHPAVGFVKGSGNAMFTLRNGLLAQYLVRIPVAFLLAKGLGLGLTGVALAWISAPVFSLCTYTHYIRNGKWKARKLVS